MPRQVIPLEGIDKVGLIADMPAVSLPSGAWSDVRNVRFDDGAIRKFKGHIPVFDDAMLMNIQHVAYWENPNRRYYIVIDSDTEDTVYTLQLEDDGSSTLLPRGTFDIPLGGLERRVAVSPVQWWILYHHQQWTSGTSAYHCYDWCGP